MSIKRIIILSGAFTSMFIGTGFATGQETMQYFANYGILSFAGIALFLAISVWINPLVINYGYDSKEKPVRATYQFYFGKIFGTIFDYLIPLFLLATMVTMSSGAGSIFQEQWGWSPFIGVLIITAVMLGSYLLGSKRLIEILGVIGPVIIIGMALAALYAIFKGSGLANVDELVAAADGYKMGEHWWWASLQYAAFVPAVMVPFLSKLGRESDSRKEAIVGAVIGVCIVSLAILITNIAVLSNYSLVASANVPMVMFASMMSPVFGTIFAVIIFLGLYSTAAPMLWIVCAALPTHKNKKADALVATAICVVILFAGQLPFKLVMNTLYPIIAYSALVWLVFAIITQIRVYIGKNKEDDNIAA